jgi:predicted signal transduction protein with EAL and GGDEF domain
MSMHQSSNLRLEDRLPKTELGQLALVVSLMLGVALVDYLSGNLLRVYPLYFIPIALAALTLGRLGAMEILEKLSAAIESSMRLMDCTVTASIGAAVYGVHPPGIDEAIQAADEVMYAVKNSGKNQVRVRYLG